MGSFLGEEQEQNFYKYVLCAGHGILVFSSMVKNTGVRISSGMLRISCVTLGKLLHLSGPQCLQRYDGYNRHTDPCKTAAGME